MTNPAHFFGGYLVLASTKKHWLLEGLSTSVGKRLLIYGLVLTLVVDLDVLLAGGIAGHHKYVTHYPFFWLVVSFCIFLFSLFFRSKTIKAISIVTLIATWTHLFLDLFGVTMGIHLLWPFSMAEYSITPLRTDFTSEQERMRYIFQSPTVLVGDSIVIIAGLIKLLKDLFVKK